MTMWLGGMWASFDEGQTKAVGLDMQKVSCAENQKENRVTPAVACLSQKWIGAGRENCEVCHHLQQQLKRRLLACPCFCGKLF
jgi:hypothetical protein